MTDPFDGINVTFHSGELKSVDPSSHWGLNRLFSEPTSFESIPPSGQQIPSSGMTLNIPLNYFFPRSFGIAREFNPFGIVFPSIEFDPFTPTNRELSRVATTELKLDPPEKIKEYKGDVCPICLEEFKMGEMVNELDCKHIFHTGCVKEWGRYKAVCPICRHSIPSSENTVHGFGRSSDL